MNISIELLQEIIDYENDNVDALIRIDGEGVWTATFFTLRNIGEILENYRNSGECLSGKFFWAKDLVVVEDLRFETIRSTVFELVRTGEHKLALGILNAQ